MIRQFMVFIISGLLFGAGLAISGMADPQRVRGFLDVFGQWDPTLAFVMTGALTVMAIAWILQSRLPRPLSDSRFELPISTKIDQPLVTGAILFGIGWGIAGLCPGPALIGLVIQPYSALSFVVAMLIGMVFHRVLIKS